ncbi:MAG: hypothetical protein R3B47_19670 [Bacteroidia bacterium]
MHGGQLLIAHNKNLLIKAECVAANALFKKQDRKKEKMSSKKVALWPAA